MDPNRLKVDRGVLHHAVTPLWEDKSKAWLAQWFSDNGYARAYGSNPANWSGLINPFTGGRSYSQTHAVGQRVTAATPDATAAERAAGYRVFYIVKNPVGVITWHAGNWNVNQRSIAIENLGDYRNYALRDGDMKVIADFFRPLDQAVGGAMQILLHFEVYATACPARIQEARNKIVNYINNPPAPPKPPEPPKPEPNVVKYEKMNKGDWKFVVNANLWDFNHATHAKMKSVGSFKAGDVLTIVGKAVHRTGSEYYMTEYSFGDADKTGKPNYTNGINKNDLVKVKAPVVEVKEEIVERVVPFAKRRIANPALAEGHEYLEVKGVDGLVNDVYSVTYTDGKETARELKRIDDVREMIVETIVYGTMKPGSDLEPGDGEDAKSWLTRVIEWVFELLSKFTYKK